MKPIFELRSNSRLKVKSIWRVFWAPCFLNLVPNKDSPFYFIPRKHSHMTRPPNTWSTFLFWFPYGQHRIFTYLMGQSMYLSKWRSSYLLYNEYSTIQNHSTPSSRFKACRQILGKKQKITQKPKKEKKKIEKPFSIKLLRKKNI